MRRHHLLATGFAFLLLAASASAALMDARKNQAAGEAGYWVIPQNTTDTITFYTGEETGDPDLIYGFDLGLLVGGGASSAPAITAADLIGTGTYGSGWDSPYQLSLQTSGSYSPQDAFVGAYDDGNVGAEVTDGLHLAYITVSTAGVAPGDYTISFEGGTGTSTYLDEWGDPVSTSFQSGMIRVTSGVIPEPAVVVQLMGLFATGGVGFLLRRRRKLARD